MIQALIDICASLGAILSNMGASLDTDLSNGTAATPDGYSDVLMGLMGPIAFAGDYTPAGIGDLLADVGALLTAVSTDVTVTT